MPGKVVFLPQLRNAWAVVIGRLDLVVTRQVKGDSYLPIAAWQKSQNLSVAVASRDNRSDPFKIQGSIR